MRYWKWVVAQDKVKRQLVGLRTVLQSERLKFHAIFPVEARTPENREYLRQLEIQIAKCEVALTELAGMKKDPSKVWDRIVVMAYNWAVYNR